MTKFWKYVGPYKLLDAGKYISDSILIAGRHGASIIRNVETKEVQFLIVNGQIFEVAEE